MIKQLNTRLKEMKDLANKTRESFLVELEKTLALQKKCINIDNERGNERKGYRISTSFAKLACNTQRLKG